MRLSGWSNVAWIVGLALTLGACGGKDEATPEAPAPAAAEPAKEAPAAEARGEEPTTAAAPAPKPAEEATAPKPTEEVPAPKPADAAAAAPTEVVVDDLDAYVYPARNTVVRDPDPSTPEGIIARALAAAMNPDEAAGWREFEALLHTSEKLPNALTSRRQLNWPAMRRKVPLFLVEDETKPIYRWSYVEELPNNTLKIFVHNKESMPTPCYLRRDAEQDNAWRITTCSL